MDEPQSPALRAILSARYAIEQPGIHPRHRHNPAENGYTDTEKKIAISFPNRG